MIKTVFGLMCLFGTSYSFAEETPLPIKVACNLPLTGDLSVYGSAVEEGVRFFQSSLPENFKSDVTFSWQDNEGKGSKTLSIAKFQLASNPDIYISGIKPQYMTIESILNKETKLPNFVWVFDSFLRSNNKNNFRTYVNFKSEAELFLKHIAIQNNVKKVAIIHVITPTVVEQQNTLVVPGLNKLGLNDNLVIPYQMDQLDFKSIALKVKKFNPDFIFLSGFQHNLAPLIRSFRTLSLIKENNTVATYDMLDAITLLRPDEIKNIKFAMPAFLLSNEPKFLDWKKRFLTHFKKEPLYTHIYAHEMAAIIYDVASRFKADPSQNVIELLNATNIEGLIGKLKFDSNGDIETDVVYGTLENGVLSNSGV